jgi:hypothetical protein
VIVVICPFRKLFLPPIAQQHTEFAYQVMHRCDFWAGAELGKRPLLVCTQVLGAARHEHGRLSGREIAVLHLRLHSSMPEVLGSAGAELRYQLGHHAAAARVPPVLNFVPELRCIMAAGVPAFLEVFPERIHSWWLAMWSGSLWELPRS